MSLGTENFSLIEMHGDWFDASNGLKLIYYWVKMVAIYGDNRILGNSWIFDWNLLLNGDKLITDNIIYLHSLHNSGKWKVII